MHLYSEYNETDLGALKSWARLVLPNNELPCISKALKQYTYMPWHLSRNTLYKNLLDASNIAARYFDQNVCPTEQKRKYLTRYARMEESIENNDGSLLFIKDKEDFLGYIRVMPISTEQWEHYYNSRKISEAEFIPQHQQSLKDGNAHIYIQAIVFPDGKDLGARNKLALQESAIAGLIGNLLPDSMLEEGINVYFTAFHKYTIKFAKRLGIPPVDKNKHGNTIYGFNISQYASENSLGGAIFKRWQEGKTQCSRFNKEQHDTPMHSTIDMPSILHDDKTDLKILSANTNKN